jgi:hypothetical protein
MSDDKVAAIGRRLAEALRDYAYTRKDDDKKRVVALQVELIEYVKSEEKAGE